MLKIRILKLSLIKHDFFNEPYSLDYVEIWTALCKIMLDPLDYTRFIESA